MSDVVRIEEHNDYTIKIYQDDTNDSPRDWDNLGTMVCFHRRYNLGDSHTYTVESIKEYVQRHDVLSLPLYLYDHSGLTMNTRGFHCPWDSGQVGFIVVDKERVRKEYNVGRVTPQTARKALSVLEAEVRVYDQYLTGDVYGYVVEKNGEHVDSLWGLYGLDYALEQAREVAS